MKDLRTIQVAQQLTKNLMWLERSNPLLPISELLAFGCQHYGRIREQYLQIEDFWMNDFGRMKTLEMMMRYLLRCELDTISAAMAAPTIQAKAREEGSRERALSTLGRGYKLDLSLAMPRGRAELLGGGSSPICTTA